MKMVKKLVSVALIGVLAVSMLTGCGEDTASTTGTESTATLDKGLQKEVADAMAQLQTKDTYLINNQLSAPDGATNYLEIVDKGESYTEYKVDDSKNAEGAGGTEKDYQYTLQDWCALDGSAYITVDNQWYKFPEGYGELLGSRKVMYADRIIPKLTSLRKTDETEKADIGDGEEEFTIYTGECPAEVAQEILGISTMEVYEYLLKEFKDDEKYKNEVHLAELYLSDLNKTMTVSDATVEFGVCDGILRELNITVGGLGTKLKFFRAVSFKSTYDKVTKPDALKAENIPSIIETLSESAEFAKDYDTYDDMVIAYQKKAEEEQKLIQDASVTPSPDATTAPVEDTKSDKDKSGKNKKDKDTATDDNSEDKTEDTKQEG